MIVNLRVTTALAARWRRRLATLCNNLARSKLRVSKSHEVQDGFLLAASRNGEFVTGTILDFPQYLLFASQFPNSNFGPLGEVGNQCLQLDDRAALYPTLKDELPFDPVKRSVTYGVDIAGNQYNDEGKYWSTGPSVVTGRCVAMAELRSRGGADYQSLRSVQPGTLLTIELRVVKGNTLVALDSAELPEPQRKNCSGIIFSTDDLNDLAPGFHFMAYNSLNYGGRPPGLILAGGQSCMPFGMVLEDEPDYLRSLVIAPTFRSTYPYEYIATTTDVDPRGVCGIVFASASVSYEVNADGELVPVVEPLVHHFSFDDHPETVMRPIEGPYPVPEPITRYRWSNTVTAVMAAAYGGGVAVLSTQYCTNIEIVDEAFEIVYSSCTMLSRMVGAGIAHSVVRSSSNTPALGSDVIVYASYTSEGAAYFHAVRTRPSDISEFDPIQPISGEVTQYKVIMDIIEDVVYVVTSSGVTESVKSSSTLGWVGIGCPPISEGNLRPTYYYDDFTGVASGGSGEGSKFAPKWAAMVGGWEQCAQLDEHRVVIPVTDIGAVIDPEADANDRVAGVVIYDTTTGIYSAPYWFGNYVRATPAIISRAVLDEDGLEITPAVLTVSLIPNTGYLTGSQTLVSYDSGATFDPLVVGTAPTNGAFFIGNGLNLPVQGDPWRVQPSEPEE